MKIGIAITTHNRPDVCKETYSIIDSNRPENSILIVVDDASHPAPFGYGGNMYNNVYRFDKNVGVGVAKNKCLELLHDAGCTHFFLFDDDCRPKENEWWLHYTESTLNHACWTFDRRIVYDMHGFYREFEKPNGCMLYFTRKAIDKVGGWDSDFKGYGYEHCNISDRIYNNGLTPARYIDIPDSKGLFELADCESSFTYADRAQIPNNLHLYQQKFYSKEFKPFK